MKKFLSGLLVLVMLFAVILPAGGVYAHANEKSQGDKLKPISIGEINYEVNKNLTEERVHERFEQINSKYQINEPFSSEDTEFVRAYASLNVQNDVNQLSDISLLSDTKSEYFNEVKSKYYVSVNFYGRVTSTLNVVNHSYRGDVTANITSGEEKVNKIETTVTNVAYGLLGNSGTYIGIVYDDSISSSTSSRTTWSMDKTVNYSAVGVVYTYTNAYATITTSSGSFNLYGL